MTKEKYIVNVGRNLTLKGGIVGGDYIFGINEVTGDKPQETIRVLLERKVIKQLKSELEPESKSESEPLKKKRGRRKSKK